MKMWEETFYKSNEDSKQIPERSNWEWQILCRTTLRVLIQLEQLNSSMHLLSVRKR